jgi:hypothetical protein
VPTSFDVAVIELCRYVMALPEGSHAALWTFGSVAQRIIPAPSDPRRWVPVNLAAGSDQLNSLRVPLSRLDAADLKSDFESALGTISGSYHRELMLGHEMHVVLLSDFVHDLGPGREGGAEVTWPVDDQRAFVERQHAASMRMVERRFRLLSRAGVMFHLAAVVGTEFVSHSELALASNSLEWRSYRVTRHETFVLPIIRNRGNLGAGF